MSHLRLINLYPYPLRLQFNFDVFYHTPKADELYSHQGDTTFDGLPPYSVFKHMNRTLEDAQRLALRLEESRDLLKKANIDDYSIVQPGNNKLEFYFKSNKEQACAAAVLAPNKVIEVPFYDGSDKNISAQRLEQIRVFLQSSYDQVDLESAQLTARVKLRADFARSAIHAQARAIDIPRVLIRPKYSRTRLKTANPLCILWKAVRNYPRTQEKNRYLPSSAFS